MPAFIVTRRPYPPSVLSRISAEKPAKPADEAWKAKKAELIAALPIGFKPAKPEPKPALKKPAAKKAKRKAKR